MMIIVLVNTLFLQWLLIDDSLKGHSANVDHFSFAMHNNITDDTPGSCRMLDAMARKTIYKQ